MTKLTVNTSPATRYTVRNGWAWAYLYVDHGVVTDDKLTSGERRWVNVSVISDYGSFGFCWSHIGGDWRDFLASLDFDYAMKKMMGLRLWTPLDVSEAADKARGLVVERRRHDGLTRADARQLFDAIESARGDAFNCQHFLAQWDSESNCLMSRHDLYDDKWEKYDPQAEGFWSEIWPHFTAAIIAERAEAVAA
jgi:hypothetical protein